MVSPITIDGGRYTAGVAYIAMPSDLDRNEYLKDCYTNMQVCILMEDGGFHSRVPISNEVLNFIEFPQTARELGSAVVYVTEQLHQQIIIVARMQTRDDLGDGKENQFKFTRKFNGALVEISGSPTDRRLNLTVDGDDAKGAINLHVFNKNGDSALNIDVSGDVNINASGSTVVSQQKQFSSTTIDPDAEEKADFIQTSTENKFHNKKLTVNDGTDPLVRGNELKSLLSDLIDELSKITTATAIGTQPVLNKLQILKFKERLDDIKSTVVFTDK